MKGYILIVCLIVLNCCSAGRTVEEKQTNAYQNDSILFANPDSVEHAATKLPACIKKLIGQFKKEEKQNPPRSIYRYSYNGKTVYYVPAICCDFFSDLYDSKCNLIAHPDGGFTGRGDGKASDFIKKRTGEKLVWKDIR